LFAPHLFSPFHLEEKEKKRFSILALNRVVILRILYIHRGGFYFIFEVTEWAG